MLAAIFTATYLEDSLPEALRKLHSLGWTVFEMADEHIAAIDQDENRREVIEETLQVLAELDLYMPQAHAKLTADVARPDAELRNSEIATLMRHMDWASQLGVKNVVIHPGRGNGCATPEERRRIFDLNVDSFRRLADRAGELGLRIGIENMMNASEFGSTAGDLLELLAAVDSSALGVTIDTSHANVRTGDTAGMIRQLGPAIFCTHISDNNGTGDQHLAPGNGNIDWPGVVSALKDIGYDGTFNLEIGGERHPVPEITAMKLQHALNVTNWLLR